MKLITALFLLLAWQVNAETIAKQGDAEVNMQMFDAFSYGLPNDILVDYYIDRDRLETTMINFLNIELINQYVVSNGLSESELFRTAKKELEERYQDKKINTEFVTKLGYDPEEFKKILFDFDLKKEYYKKMQYQLINEKDDSEFEELAREQYLAKRKDFTKPEKRDISHIFLDFRDKDKREVFSRAEKILAQLVENEALFDEVALENSEDPTVESNKGYIGEFTKRQLDSSISGQIFSEETTGLIPRLLENSQGYFIVRVNEIIPTRKVPYEEAKVGLISNIRGRVGQKKFQNILTEQSKSKIDINPTAIEKVVKRYDIFIEKQET